MTETEITSLDNQANDIYAIARSIEQHVADNWQTVLQIHHAKLLDAYNRVGDMAYGTYLNLLFRPVHRQLKAAGLRPWPQLPGKFDISREWGTAEETDQQRWMWSTIKRSTGEPLGTIVIAIFHDHTQFRVPRQPQVIALTETGKQAVIEALSQRSSDFQQAREAKIEIAEYLQSLENQRKEASMDPNNPVVKLCIEGMQAEGAGQLAAARALFLQAWAARQDDYDACIAAHYVARHRPPAETRHWNQVALDHADLADATLTEEFYPSLYLNMGWSHEQLGNLAEAGRYYDLATAKLDILPDGPYAEVVRKGVAAGRARLAEALGQGGGQ